MNVASRPYYTAFLPISYMNLDLMKFETDKVAMFVPELLEQILPAQQLESMVLMWYSESDICALSHLEK